MKPKYLFLVSFFLTLASVGLWRYLKSSAINSMNIAVATSLSKSTVPRSVTATAVTNPVTSSVAANPTSTASSIQPHPDEQAELNGTIATIAVLMKTGAGMSEVYKTFTPPNKFDADHYEKLLKLQENIDADSAKDPKLQKGLTQFNENMAQSWTELENQTPTFNAAVNQATYKFSIQMRNGRPPLTLDYRFSKIYGKWYLDP